ncbi:MAG: glycosyltransferase family 4 protein, partial [Nitrososphaeria archaeon]
MRVLQVYETGKVRLGTSVGSVVLNLSKCLAELGVDVVVIERGKGKNPFLESVGIESIQIDMDEYSSAPYKDVKTLSGLVKLILDRIMLALEYNKVIKRENFDVIHVHFPFASSILLNLRRELKKRMVYTAHIGEETKRFALGSSSPLALRLFSPDLYLMKRVAKTVVLNE